MRALRDDPRVGGEDAVDVGVDLADVGLERGRERDGRGVGAAAAEGGDLLGVGRDALEAGDDDDVAVADRLGDPAGRDVDDLGLAVHRVGDHAGLRAGERAGGEAEVADRHRDERHRDALARGEQHVHLAGRRQRRDARGQVLQVVGRVAHGGHGDDDVVAGLLDLHDAPRDALDGVGVGERGAAVLLHDNAHGWSSRIGVRHAGRVRRTCPQAPLPAGHPDSTAGRPARSPASHRRRRPPRRSSSKSVSNRSCATTVSSALSAAPARLPQLLT